MDNKNNLGKQSEDFLSISDFWHLCIAHWNWFLISLIICLGYSTYYLSKTPYLYSRKAAILVKKENTQPNTTGQDGQLMSDVSVIQQTTNVPSVQRQLVSLQVQSEVARRLHMGETAQQQFKAAQGLAARLQTSSDNEKSSVITLRISDTSPEMAEKILSTTVQVFNEQWLANKNHIAASTSAFIQDRLTLLERELGAVDDSISNFKARNKITDINRISDIYLQKQNTSEAQILVLTNQKSMAEYILSILNDKELQHQLLPSNSGISNSAAESQITQYNNMLLQLKNSMYHTSSQNPLIGKQESDLEDIRQNIIATINNHVKALDIQLDSYISESGEADDKITQNPDKAKQLLSVERAQKVKESLYLYLLQKKEENEIGATYSSYITEMIDQPHGSDVPTSPQTNNIIFSSILLALLVPAVILFLRESFDNTIRDRFDVDRKTSIPLIGEVPLFVYDPFRKKTVAVSRYNTFTWRDFLFWRDRESRLHHSIVVEPDKQDIVNEAFRIIRTNLEFMTNKQGDKNVYIVTSNYEGSGKTFVSINLSIALAIKEKRVLLVDGDLRHASTSRHLDCTKSGVSDYLADDKMSLDDVIAVHPQYTQLHILPVGTIPPNPTELLASDRFSELINGLRSQYDFIIIDCPPSEVLADTDIIERQADRTLFVLRAGLFERKRLDDLASDAQNGKYKQMSLILNGTKLGGRYGYRYRYRYRYGYGKKH